MNRSLIISFQKSDENSPYSQSSDSVGCLIYSNFINGFSTIEESDIFGTKSEISSGICPYQLISLINFSLFVLVLITFSPESSNCNLLKYRVFKTNCFVEK